MTLSSHQGFVSCTAFLLYTGIQKNRNKHIFKTTTTLICLELWASMSWAQVFKCGFHDWMSWH